MKEITSNGQEEQISSFLYRIWDFVLRLNSILRLHLNRNQISFKKSIFVEKRIKHSSLGREPQHLSFFK